jgi:hypothetical protein
MRPLTRACVSLIFIATAAISDRSPVAAQRNNHPHLYGGACGVQRWSVKTGTDSDARSVNLSRVIPTTIEYLDSLRPPASLPNRSRIRPVETTVFQVSASLIRFKQEPDSDYHLVLRDDVGRTMIAEIPAPYCVGGTSPFRGHIAAARAGFASLYSSPALCTTFVGASRSRVLGSSTTSTDRAGLPRTQSSCIPCSPSSSVAKHRREDALGATTAERTEWVQRARVGLPVVHAVRCTPTLYARTMSGATCTASVVYSTGRSPRSFDGYAQTVGRSGVVGWSWHEETRDQVGREQ